MNNPDLQKDSFRRFLIFFCSWNFVLDVCGIAFLIWFATFIEDTERVMGHFVLIDALALISVIRIIICFGFMIVKLIQKKWKQFFVLLIGFFIQLFITVCFCGISFLVYAAATVAVGDPH